jgi:FixJ family two-component response regulator
MQRTNNISIKPHIYLIDHDEHSLSSLLSLLEPLNATIQCFTSAESFLLHSFQDKTSCLLLEAHLPGLSGVELMEHLNKLGHDIPTIVLSSMSDIPTAVRAMRARAIDFLEKPYVEHKVLKQVEKILEQY